jgi:hypothetical protein
VPVDLKQDHSHWASMRFTTMGHGTSACDRYLVFLDNIWGACLAMTRPRTSAPLADGRTPSWRAPQTGDPVLTSTAPPAVDLFDGRHVLLLPRLIKIIAR